MGKDYAFTDDGSRAGCPAIGCGNDRDPSTSLRMTQAGERIRPVRVRGTRLQ